MIHNIALLTLLVRVMSDQLPQRCDAAYLVAQTGDNMDSPLARGVRLYQENVVPKIALQYGGMGFGYCGFGYCRRVLRDAGVPEESLVRMSAAHNPHFKKSPNTLTELIKVMQMAKKWGWQRLVIVASPFHQVRSFTTAVTVAHHEYPELELYSCPGIPLSWDEHVVHSQGTTTGTRVGIFEGECKRIKVYGKSGGKPYPLLSPEKVLKYLEARA